MRSTIAYPFVRLTASILLALVLSACAATGPADYGPANVSKSRSAKFGYEETKLETARYRITYYGSGGMSLDQVDRLALRRAAEITLAEGFDWFRVVNHDVSGEERGGVSVGGGVGSGSVGRRSSVGLGVGGNFGTVGGRDYYTVRLEVILGDAERPDQPEFYDARSVLENAASDALGDR